MSDNNEARVIKSVTLTVDEANAIWKVCQDLGYRQWSPCLRHLILKYINQDSGKVNHTKQNISVLQQGV